MTKKKKKKKKSERKKEYTLELNLWCDSRKCEKNITKNLGKGGKEAMLKWQEGYDEEGMSVDGVIRCK